LNFTPVDGAPFFRSVRGCRIEVLFDYSHCYTSFVCPSRHSPSPKGLGCVPSRPLLSIQSFNDYYTRWKSARFRVGQILNPYLPHYRVAFAFSILPYLLSRQFLLRVPCLTQKGHGGKSGLPRSQRYQRIDSHTIDCLGSASPPVVVVTTYS
jgi:hypothetical protein